MRLLNRTIATFALVFCFQAVAFAATQDSVVKLELKSELMGRTMNANVFGPRDFARQDRPLMATVYLLHGLAGKYDNWVNQGGAANFARKYNVLVVMPEGENGWYVDSETNANSKYESYIIEELIPKIQGTFRSSPEREHNVIAGLSMGGYGALKFGIKYPEKFAVAGSFSGALRAPEWDQSAGSGWPLVAQSIMAAFGPMGSKTRAENDIYKLIEGMTDEDLKKLPYFYVDCGTEDILIGLNNEFAGLLLKRKVPHEFRQLPGLHDWNYWTTQVLEFGSVLDKKIKRPQ